jgi:cytochrome c oxidase cbb3-type subunit I/II
MFTTGIDPAVAATVQPYTPLEVAGRDIYTREGCYVCHSQMVRPFRDETLRYGAWSRSEEYAWDRPFLLGSRRIGPDLHRVGGKYPDAWHYEHMLDPRSTSPGSVMPSYWWLHESKIDPEDIRASVVALSRVGTPYSPDEIANVPKLLQEQGEGIVTRMAESGSVAAWDDEIVALTAYLQRLGKDRKGVLAEAGAP